MGLGIDAIPENYHGRYMTDLKAGALAVMSCYLITYDAQSTETRQALGDQIRALDGTCWNGVENVWMMSFEKPSGKTGNGRSRTIPIISQ